jgi:uncharacterized protein (DUF58 family)
MRIKNLELRARAIVEGFLTGLHRSPYHGFSVEFTEYRQYSPGDDTRFLDWKLFARSDRYFIKRFEDETNLRCHLLVDLSRSMSYGTVGYDKAEYAKTAAATIGYFLSLQRDAVGLLTFDESIVDLIPARFRPGHMHRLMMSLERAPAGTATDIERPLEQVAATVAKRGMVVLISDLLTPIGSLEKNLGYLRARGHEVVLLRVLDPTEIDFSFDEPAMFHDVESGRDLYIDPDTARENYLMEFREHADALQTICNSLGVDLHQLSIDRPLELILFDLLTDRMKRGRPSVRQRAPRGGHTS